MQQSKLFPPTQLEAYHKNKINFGHMHQIIWDIIARNPGSCNKDILDTLRNEYPKENGRDWEICSVTGRVKELREMSRVICIGYKLDGSNKVMAWGAV